MEEFVTSVIGMAGLTLLWLFGAPHPTSAIPRAHAQTNRICGLETRARIQTGEVRAALSDGEH